MRSRPGSGRQAGAALFLVTVLLLVMVIVIMDLLSSSQIQAIVAQNISDEHLAGYVEETAIIKAEEFLWQDVTPPPMREDRQLSAEQLLVEDRQKKSDSYHDFWAGAPHIEQVGKIWMRTRIEDEERKFNVNSLVNPASDDPMPLQNELFRNLLVVLGVRGVDVPDVVEEFIDYIDRNEKGKYEDKSKNAPMGMLRECLSMENMDRELYEGASFPRGEVPDEMAGAAFVPATEDEAGAADRNPFKDEPPPPVDEWDGSGIRAGLKDVLTVYGKGIINLNTAPLPVLEALFDSREVALELIRERRKAPFNSFEQVKMVAGVMPGLTKYQSILGFTSEFFRVEMEFHHKRNLQRKFAVMRRSGGQALTLFKGGGN